jgi:DNA polymerase
MNKLQILNNLENEYKQCNKCKLCDSRTNVVFGYGNIEYCRCLVIAEAPGNDEDIEGVPLIGMSGRILDAMLCEESKIPELQLLASTFKKDKQFSWNNHHEAKQKLGQFIYYTNTVLCRPEDNRDPENEEIKACRERLFETIYTLDPTIILSVGKHATSILANKVVTITKVRGQVFDFHLPGKTNSLTYAVMPILHPSYLARNREYIKKNSPWQLTKLDIRTMFDLLGSYDA